MNIRGLTLIRPWPWAIVEGGKRIENRSWTPTNTQLLPCDWIAIHAGKKWDDDAVAFILEEIGLRVPDESSHVSGAIVGVAQYFGSVTNSKSPWFFGPYGWLIDNVIALPDPIPHRGALGLWTLEAAAYAKCKAIVEAA